MDARRASGTGRAERWILWILAVVLAVGLWESYGVLLTGEVTLAR